MSCQPLLNQPSTKVVPQVVQNLALVPTSAPLSRSWGWHLCQIVSSITMVKDLAWIDFMKISSILTIIIMEDG